MTVPPILRHDSFRSGARDDSGRRGDDCHSEKFCYSDGRSQLGPQEAPANSRGFARIPKMWRSWTRSFPCPVQAVLANSSPSLPDYETCGDGSGFHTCNMIFSWTVSVRATRALSRSLASFRCTPGSLGKRHDALATPKTVPPVVTAEPVWDCGEHEGNAGNCGDLTRPDAVNKLVAHQAGPVAATQHTGPVEEWMQGFTGHRGEPRGGCYWESTRRKSRRCMLPSMWGGFPESGSCTKFNWKAITSKPRLAYSRP